MNASKSRPAFELSEGGGQGGPGVSSILCAKKMYERGRRRDHLLANFFDLAGIGRCWSRKARKASLCGCV